MRPFSTTSLGHLMRASSPVRLFTAFVMASAAQKVMTGVLSGGS